MSSSSVVTLAAIRLQAQQRADMVNSTFISTPEWNQMITNSYKELYDLRIAAYGDDYDVASPYSFITDGVNQLFNLPSDFYKLLGAEISINSSPQNYITLTQFNFSERNTYAYPNQQSYSGTVPRYHLIGSQIMLRPLPQGGQTIQLWYVPEPTNLTLDTDTMDGISGWEEYVIVDAALKARIKEETDVSELAASKAAMIKRLQDMTNNRDASMPATVADVRQDYPCGYGYGMDPWGNM